MDNVISWLAEYWWVLLVFVLPKVLNVTTKHFSEHRWLVKVCLFLVDILDVIKSTPAPGGKK